MPISKPRHALRIRQKSKTMYITTFSATELEEICGTPRLSEEDLKNPSKFQRDLAEKKVSNIGTWWDKKDSFLPNSVIIQFTDKNAIAHTFPGESVTGTITVTPNPKKKVANLLDGQHRVIGCSRSASKHDEPLITTIVSDQFNKSQVGTMFIEMNNEATKLGPIHIMHLKARYNMKPYVAEGKLAYELMMKLWEETGTNPLHSKGEQPSKRKIQILDKQHGQISAKKLTDQLTKIYVNSPSSFKNSTDDDFSQISDFLDVFTKYWADDWKNRESAINNSDIFCDLIVPLYTAFLSNARTLIPSTDPDPNWPERHRWEQAIKCEVDYIDSKNNPKKCNLNEYISWANDIYPAYKIARTHPQISKLLQDLISTSSDKAILDFTSLKTNDKKFGYDNFQEYLRQYIPKPFDLNIIDDGGVTVPNLLILPVSPPKNLYLLWTRSPLTKKKAFITIEHGGVILRQGEFTSNTQHDLFYNQIPKSGFDGFESGKKYKITVKQICANTKSTSQTLDVEFV